MGRELRVRRVQGPLGGGCQKERPGSESTRGRARKPRRHRHPRADCSGCRGSIFSCAIFVQPFFVFDLDFFFAPGVWEPAPAGFCSLGQGLGFRAGRRVQLGSLVPISTFTFQGCRVQGAGCRAQLGILQPVSDLAGLRGAEPGWGPSSLSLTGLQEDLGAQVLDLCPKKCHLQLHAQLLQKTPFSFPPNPILVRDKEALGTRRPLPPPGMLGISGWRHSWPEKPEAREASPPGYTLWARPEAWELRSPQVGRTHAGVEEATAPSSPIAKAKWPLSITVRVTDPHIARGSPEARY
ncbi:hypothetical protein NN561_015369 [Cricetulus griseus]